MNFWKFEIQNKFIFLSCSIHHNSLWKVSTIILVAFNNCSTCNYCLFHLYGRKKFINIKVKDLWHSKDLKINPTCIKRYKSGSQSLHLVTQTHYLIQTSCNTIHSPVTRSYTLLFAFDPTNITRCILTYPTLSRIWKKFKVYLLAPVDFLFYLKQTLV